MESWLHRLFVPRVQHKHGTFSDGFTRSVALGEASDDGAGIDFIYECRTTRGASREHPIVKLAQDVEGIMTIDESSLHDKRHFCSYGYICKRIPLHRYDVSLLARCKHPYIVSLQ